MKTVVQTPASVLQRSLNFYSTLNFHVVLENDPTIVSDGKAFICVNPDKFARPGLRLYSPHWKERVDELSKLTPVKQIPEGYLLSAPSGLWIYLIEKQLEIDLTPKDSSDSILGNYIGVGVETIATAESAEIWRRLGFTQDSPDWPAYTDENNVTVTFFEPNSCPHLFYNPSLIYFNGKQNRQIIENIQELNIPITEEITHFSNSGCVENIVIRDPAGLGFFIFND